MILPSMLLQCAKEHLEFDSTSFSTDYAWHCSPRNDHKGDTIVCHFVRDLGQNKHIFFLSHLLGYSWPLWLPSGRGAIEDVVFFVEDNSYSLNPQLALLPKELRECRENFC